MLRTHHFNHPKGGVTPVKHKKGNMDAHYMSGSYFGEEKYHGENPDEVEEKESKEVTKAKNLLESKNKNKKKVDVTTNSTADNKEVVSKTSPGPGWTKTKGTNIWAPPIEDKKTNKSLASTAVGEVPPELLATLKKNPQNTATQEELASSKGRPIDDYVVEKKGDILGYATNKIKTADKYLAKKKREFTTNLMTNVIIPAVSSNMNTGDKVDLTLSGGGMAPVYGIVADAANVIQNTGQAIFNAVTGDIPEAKKDAVNALWAAGGMIPAGIGQWFTGMKYGKATAKLLEAEKTNAKVTAEFINNATEAEIKSSKLLTDAEKFEIVNVKVDARLAKEAAEAGVINGVKYYKGANHFGKIDNIEDFSKATNEIYDGVRQTGKLTDDALAKIDFNVATDLTPENVSRIGTMGTIIVDGKKVPRGIYEVAYPDGTKQRFWRSTSGGGKTVTLASGEEVSSLGYFGTIAGHMDVGPGILGEAESLSRVNGVNGWFVKGDEWMGYGVKTYEETGAVLKNFFEQELIK